MALEKNAASVILVHNHPSGNPEPSQEDIDITKRIKEAGIVMGVGVIDHIIITKNKTYSFKEDNLI
jgi:DNA repair protein RadC